MKRKRTAYTTFIVALSKPFNKTSLMTLLIAVTLYMISGVSADEGVVPGVSAEEISNGQMAGIIRSANHPCAKVIELQPVGENSWKVQCNSGSFNVTRNADGLFSVNASN